MADECSGPRVCARRSKCFFDPPSLAHASQEELRDAIGRSIPWRDCLACAVVPRTDGGANRARHGSPHRGTVLLGTFVRLRSIPSGVRPKQLTVFQVTLKGDRYANIAQTMQFVTTVLDQLRRTPGVDSVAAVNGLPLDRGLNTGRQSVMTGRTCAKSSNSAR